MTVGKGAVKIFLPFQHILHKLAVKYDVFIRKMCRKASKPYFKPILPA